MFKSILTVASTITLIILTSCSQKVTTDKKVSLKEPFNLEKSLVLNDYIKIPLTKEISGHLQLNGSINGVNGSFILDTGAGATVIEQSLKEKFKMTSIKTDDTATGAGGAVENMFLTLMDLNYVNDAFESLGIQKADGVIGADVLTDGKAIIDYYNLALYLKK